MTKGLSPWMEPFPPSSVKPTPAAPLMIFTVMGPPCTSTETQLTGGETPKNQISNTGHLLPSSLPDGDHLLKRIRMMLKVYHSSVPIFPGMSVLAIRHRFVNEISHFFSLKQPLVFTSLFCPTSRKVQRLCILWQPLSI